MSVEWRLRYIAVAIFFLLYACTSLQSSRAQASTARAQSSPTESTIAAQNDGFVVTLSDRCVLSSFRFPDAVPLARFSAGDCTPNSIARIPGQRALSIATADGALQILTLPALFPTTKSMLAIGISMLFAPTTRPYSIAVNPITNTLQVLNRDSLTVMRNLPIIGSRGQRLTATQIEESTSRRSVLIAFRENEMWELFLSNDAAPVFEGLVHDYRMGEGISEPRLLPIQRIVLDAPIDEFVVEPDSPHFIAVQRTEDGQASLLRFNLDVRRLVARKPVLIVPDSVAVTVSAGQRWLLLTTDRDGAHALLSKGMEPGLRIDHAGNGCRIATAPNGNWLVLFACRGNDAGRLFIVNSHNMTTTAALEASAYQAAKQVAISTDAQHLWAIMPGLVGHIVRYRADRWRRDGQLSIPQLRAAWVYP